MIVELRPAGAKRVSLDRRITLITGIPAEQQQALVTLIDRALRGEAVDGEVVVEVEGKRESLPAADSGPPGARRGPVVFDLTHVRVRDTERVRPEPGHAAAAISQAESAVADSRAALEVAEVAHREAVAALEEARASLPTDASAALAAAERRVGETESGVAAARRAVAEAREAAEATSGAAEAARRAAELLERRESLEARRQAIVERLTSIGEASDPAGVESALASLDRLLKVKPKVSSAAVALADEWADIRRQLDALPSPPSPPEWLAGPARTALEEAREALARAEAGAPAVDVDPEAVEALERAHRELVDAEQRATERPSRGNRKRLSQATEAEQEALRRVGVASYGDYLRDIAPAFEKSSREERIAQARAALVDAETVWNELHGGDLPPGWPELKRREDEIRAEAAALLGEPVPDDALEERLRAHVESVVDASWAEQALIEALGDAGVDVGDAPLGEAAEAWLSEARERFAARKQIEAELSELDRELTEVQSELAEHQSDAFFAPADQAAGASNAEALEQSLHAAEEAHRDALDSVDAMRRQLDAAGDEEKRIQGLEQNAAERDRARAEAQRRLEDAESALAAAREAAETAGRDVARARTSMGDGVTNLEAEMQLIVLAAAARAAGGTPLVMVGAVPPAPLGPRLLSLAARAAAGGVQVVVAGGDKDAEVWAKKRKDVRVVRP